MQTSWAPAVLLAHLAVLGLAAVVVIGLWQGIGSRSELWPVVVCTWVAVPVVAAFPANPGPVLGTVALFAAIPAAPALLVGAFVVLVLVQPPD